MKKSFIVLILSLVSVLSFAQTTGVYTSDNDYIVTTINGQVQSWDYCTWTYDSSLQTTVSLTGKVSTGYVTTCEVCLHSGDELVTVSYSSLDEEIVYTSTEGVFYFPAIFVDYNTSLSSLSVTGEGFDLSCFKGTGGAPVPVYKVSSEDSDFTGSGIQFYDL